MPLYIAQTSLCGVDVTFRKIFQMLVQVLFSQATVSSSAQTKLTDTWIVQSRTFTIQVLLAISNSTNNNSIGPDGIKDKLKHQCYLPSNITNMYNIAINTNVI